MLKIIHLNVIAICIATLVGVVLGIIWYSPIIFRKVGYPRKVGQIKKKITVNARIYNKLIINIVQLYMGYRKVLLDDLTRNNDDIKKFFFPFIISVFGIAVLAIVLDTFLFFSKLAGMDSFYAATIIGVTISVGIIALNMLSDYMIRGTHMKFFTVHASYRIVMTILMAWTLSFWR